MEIRIVYDSAFGHTETIARAMAEALVDRATVRVVPVAEATFDDHPDLLLVGGPTQRHRMSPALDARLGRLPRRGLSGLPAAAFDTRYRMARILSGSAAVAASRQLERAGCRLVAAPESFFVERDQPPKGERRRHAIEALEPGERERAAAWALGLLESFVRPPDGRVPQAR